MLGNGCTHYFIAEDWGRKNSFGGSAIQSQIIHTMLVIHALLLRSTSIASGAGTDTRTQNGYFLFLG